MKVRTGFTFDDEQLRQVRAAIGRGGKATRKECLTFIDRAVRTALDAAPAPKAARVPRTKPAPDARATETPAQEQERLRAERERIARSFGHQGVPPYPVRKALREATLAVGREVRRG